MDFQSVLMAIASWSVEDRLRLIDNLWEGTLDEGPDTDLTETQKAELERRLAEDDAAPDDVFAWEEIKAAALKRAGR
jgi:putative addiction module component (TIGR02574 family)